MNQDISEQAIGNDSYIVLLGWMINDYHLNGNELITYALIYGLSQYGNKEGFWGSINKICKWTNIKSDKTMREILKGLCEKKLISRTQVKIKGVERYLYYANKYNDGSLETEEKLRFYQGRLEEYAGSQEEYKKLRKELVINDFIDMDTFLPVEENISSFISSFPDLYNFVYENKELKEISKKNSTIHNESPVEITDPTPGKNYRPIQDNSPVNSTEDPGKNYRGGAVKFTDNNTNNNNTNNNTAAGNNKNTADNTQKAAAVSELIQNIKNLLCNEFAIAELPFSDTFYDSLISKCRLYSFNDREIAEYCSWAVQETLKKPKDNIFDYFYNVASKKYFVAKFLSFKIENSKKEDSGIKPEKTKILNYIKCPICKVQHDSFHECPNCGLPENSNGDNQEIENYTIRFNLQKNEKRMLDIELLEHENSRPKDLFNMREYQIWKQKRNDIFQKYKK